AGAPRGPHTRAWRAASAEARVHLSLTPLAPICFVRSAARTVSNLSRGARAALQQCGALDQLNCSARQMAQACRSPHTKRAMRRRGAAHRSVSGGGMAVEAMSTLGAAADTARKQSATAKECRGPPRPPRTRGAGGFAMIRPAPASYLLPWI